MAEYQKDSLSLEETNKVRISLGLKPLVDDGPKSGAAAPAEEGSALTSEDKDAIAEANYARKREEDRRAKEERETRERIAKMQNRRQLARKLQGPTLADEESTSGPAGEDSKSALKWLKQQKKRAQENAARLAKEQDEAEAMALRAQRAAASAYGEKDLAGIKVAHDLDDLDMQDGDERILTLKDTGVLDDGEDELMEASLAQKERDQLNEERKRGEKEYTGLDDEEFGEASSSATAMRHPGRSRGVLSKYDGDLDKEGMGSRQDGKSGFVLGAPAVDRDEERRKKHEEAARQLNKTVLSLDYEKNREASDYLQEGDVGFKKPKLKKKKKAVKVKLDLDEDEAQIAKPEEDVAMAVEESAPAPTSRRDRAAEASTENFVDDDELAASLARSRRLKAKKTFNKVTPEQIAKNLAAQRAAEQAAAKANGNGHAHGSILEALPGGPKEEEEDEGGLTFDATSEFVRNISLRTAADQEESESERRARQDRRSASVHVKEEPEPFTVAPTEKRVKIEEPETEDVEMGEIEAALKRQARSATRSQSPEAALEEPTASEHLVSGGMAATLALLRNSGALESVSEEQRAREREQQKYDKWLSERKAEERRREDQRTENKAQGSAKDQATREWENRQREIDDARQAANKFKDYQPDVEIKYHDKHGRELGMKEAWKNLSHTFHGRMPGYKAQEKQLRRIELEKARERMAAGDTPNGMTSAFVQRTEQTGQAHMVLGVGSRNNAPDEVALLGPNTIQPGSSSKGKGKAKEQQNGAAAAQQHLPILGAEGLGPAGKKGANHRSSASPAPSLSAGLAPRSMRPAFGTASVTPAPKGSASPAPTPLPAGAGGGGGFKLELGKRKAPMDAFGASEERDEQAKAQRR